MNFTQSRSDNLDDRKTKRWPSSSPLDSHQFPRLIAPSHQHAAIGAVTQLPQGGVAIHHLSGRAHQLVDFSLFVTQVSRSTTLSHWLSILFRFSFWLQSFFLQEDRLSADRDVTVLNSWGSKLILQKPVGRLVSNRWDCASAILQWQKRKRLRQ